MSLSLHDLGWDATLAAENQHVFTSGRPARVMQQERGAWRVHDGEGEVLARAPSRPLDPMPVTGDWVLVSGDESVSCYVEAVLPRRSTLSRAEAGGRSAEQVLAANVDVVAVCAAADAVNPRRLERELTAVWSSGATPVVVITKADTVDDEDAVLRTAESVSVGADVLVVSSLLGRGLELARAAVGPGRTLALIGPSGVGKSTLVNALVGQALLATAATRSDGKGRHTTTSRHLVLLPGGGLLLDTPGMREFAPWLGDEGLAGAFADLEQLAMDCRFADCRHDSEPDCAVLIAAASDERVGERLTNWRRLQREQAWLERRHDARLMAEERRRWASITRSVRGRTRPS